MRIRKFAAAACIAATCYCAPPNDVQPHAATKPFVDPTTASPRSAKTPDAAHGFRCDPSRNNLDAAGSNFVLSSLGRYNATHVLSDDGVKPPFVEILENPEKVKAQLQKLYAGGQRKISIVVWHAPLKGRDRAKSRVGYLVNSDGGMRPDILAGITAFFEAVKNTGFQDVVVRFGLQACARPAQWVPENRLQCPAGYSEAIENDNYSMIVQVHRALDRIFAGTTVNRRYDLAMEGVGWPDPYPTYNARIWKRYIQDFGASDTNGFSIAYQPGRLTQIYKIYDEIGVRPPVVAVDMYDGLNGKRPRMRAMLAQFAQEMEKLGLGGAPVVIQESYYNHKPTYQAIASAVQTGMNIQAVYQWPMDTLDYWYETPSRYQAYCPDLIDPTAAQEASILPEVTEQSRRLR